MDAMTHGFDPSEFLGVDVEQITWRRVLVAVRRSLGLILLGVVWYLAEGGPRLPPWSELTREKVLDVLYTHAKRDVFQTLTHIGVTSLWVLPVIAVGLKTRATVRAYSVRPDGFAP